MFYKILIILIILYIIGSREQKKEEAKGVKTNKQENNIKENKSQSLNKSDDDFWEEYKKNQLDYFGTEEEQAIQNNFYDCQARLQGFRKTNPTVNQLNSYIKYNNKRLENFDKLLSFWSRKDWDPKSSVMRDEVIDIIMRVYGFHPAHILNEFFNYHGLDEYKSLESYEDMREKISLYNSVADEVVSYIRLEDLVSLKQLKKDLKHLDSEALKWVLNRSYFIQKIDVDNDKLVEVNEDYIFKDFHGIENLIN